MVLMTNTRNGLGIRNFESNLISAPWAKKKMIDFFLLSCNAMKVEINSFFSVYVELVMLYTRHYA